MEHTQKHFPYLINGKEAVVEDATPTSVQLLSGAGFEPADDFSLIKRTPHGTRVVSADDSLDLRDGFAEFFASSAGTAFELTVNTHSIWWGDAQIEIPLLRRLANVAETDDLVWIREQAGNEILAREGLFTISDRGVEHLRTHRHEVQPTIYTFFVAGTEYTTKQESLTGAEIIALLPSWNPADSLVLESEGDEPDETILPTTVVSFKGRTTLAHFDIVPPATFG
ncbi:multiubiquitin domain-containing protein [Caballeronia zhejiangensis]|uniref:multiubiquitin domain-containing protein n=1 Tax=Caballeronia zhejiangensis TaxID=871203 RepID=UPI001EF6A20B|nr:multiubiquitin domain-containing protein [Caballeronia zhejiangensis]MCG7400387.1 multiubiquitin domain-containing protein [Caballeronia zhejiangensis]